MKVIFGRGLVVKYLLTIISSISFEDCKDACANRTTCGLGVYERRLQMCELHTNKAASLENIVKVPDSIVVTDDQCKSCISDNVTVHECAHPEEMGYTLHQGNMFSVGSSVLVLLPLLRRPRRLICLNTGDWQLVPKSQLCPDCRDCTDFQEQGYTESGVYFVNGTFYFLCTFDDSGGAWLKRFDGSIDFYRDWTNYVNGFGFLKGEFWFGLEKLHRILGLGQYELRVDLEMFDGSRYYAHYSTFNLTGASDNYRLSVGGYTGTAGNSLAIHNGMEFSTFDNDNDADHENCAGKYTGAWWFRTCYQAHLNGRYYRNGERQKEFAKYIHWMTLTGFHVSLKKTEMKIWRRLS